MYYSKSTGGFYSTKINADNIPADVVEITPEQHADFVQAKSRGMQVVADADGNLIAIDPPPPVRTKESLIADVATKRWQVETGGITIAGTPITTDRESQAQLTSAYTSLKGGLIMDTQWKAADGSFMLVTLAEIEPVAQVVASHVRACFAAEQAHDEAISALATQVDLDNYDVNMGWPGQIV